MTAVVADQATERLHLCAVEPIHIPGSVQPHGLLLLFDSASETLAHWAGDAHRFLGAHPEVGRRADDLLRTSLSDLIGLRVLIGDKEAVQAGLINPSRILPLTVALSRTGSFISVELEPATDTGTATAALERVGAISDQISSTTSPAEAYNSAAAHVQSITGYDQVMIYKFLADGSGSVVAEASAPDMPAFFQHRFPASDIPRQARELYLRSLIRVIPDINYTPADLQPANRADPIDMSHCVLRSVSPAHLKYLKNMGVGASMSVSLIVEGKLWGLIACHHRSARHVSAEGRLLCRHVGTALSAFILSFDYAEIASRTASCSMALEGALKSLRAARDPERKLRSSAEQLASLVDCAGFALLADGELVTGAGVFPDAGELREIAPYLKDSLVSHESFATDDMGQVFAGHSGIVARASGALAVLIEASQPLLAVWFRAEQIEEVAWAGDPHLKGLATDPSAALTPRQSFATWRETVRGRSRAWSSQEINAAELFRGRAELTIQRHRLKQLVDELGDANATLNGLATTDALTGLPNRRLFDERLAIAWQRALRERNSVAIVAIDVDNFKQFNDRFGHPAGDECLKLIATAIGQGNRQVDVAARLGGEEFGVLLSGTNEGGACLVAERMRVAVERLGLEHPCNDHGVVTISVGVAVGSPTLWVDPANLISAADRALYGAKKSGRNLVRFSPEKRPILMKTPTPAKYARSMPHRPG